MPAIPATIPTLSRAFKDIFGLNYSAESLIQYFDFSDLKADASKLDCPEHTLTLGLAPSFGNLTHEHLKDLDQELQIVIGSTTLKIGELKPNERTWEKIREIFIQDPLLEEEGHQTTNADRLTEETSTWFNFSETRDEHLLRQLESWFKQLIQDEDVHNATPINIQDIADVICATAASMSILPTTHKNEKKIVDIGVLRYPDVTHSYFKLYRIQLHSWAYSTTTLGMESKKSGVSGDYNCSTFKPRADIIGRLSTQIIEKALKSVDELFA